MAESPGICFVFPPGMEGAGDFRAHLGVSYLRAVLHRQGTATRQYTHPRGVSVREVVANLVEAKPRVIGFTVFDSNLHLCLNIANRIKAIDREIWTVFGGPTSTFCHEFILQSHPSVDLCVRGETEDTGTFLFSALLDSTPKRPPSWSGIPGLAVRENGRIHSTDLPTPPGSPCSRACELDRLPSPYLDGLLTDGRSGVVTARGCPHHCTYCLAGALGGRRYRLHSPERVVAELEVLAGRMRHARENYPILLVDDTFGLTPTRVRAICEQLVSKNLGLSLLCATRADAMDPDLLRLMKAAGFVSVGFGLESAVPSVLRAIGKVRRPDSPGKDLDPEEWFVEQVRRSVLWAKSAGLTAGVSIMVGLPTETPEDAGRTMAFLNELPLDYYMHNILAVVPGTPLWSKQKRFRISSSPGVLGLPVVTERPYDPSVVRPARGCNLAVKASFLRWTAIEGLYGCEVPQAKPGAVSLVVVRSNRLSPATASWIGDILGTGGTVLQICQDSRKRKGREHLEADRCALERALVPCRHHLQLIPESWSGSTRKIWVRSRATELFEIHDPDLVSFTEDGGDDSLRRWAQRHPFAGHVCEAIESARDRSRRARLGDGLLGRRIVDLMLTCPPPPLVRYGARWTCVDPPCLKLTRLEVDGDGSVRVCAHGDVIGTVGDEPAVLRKRLEGLRRQAVTRRRASAPADIACPQCPFPDVSDEEYRQIAADADTWRRIDVLSRVKGILLRTSLEQYID